MATTPSSVTTTTWQQRPKTVLDSISEENHRSEGVSNNVRLFSAELSLRSLTLAITLHGTVT
jgi:hypothetical protein